MLLDPTWRESILNEFIPQLNRLTLVADPDGLFSEEKLSLALREKGFEILMYQDPVELRYAYETLYRSRWDQGIYLDLIVLHQMQQPEVTTLPYDLVQNARILHFNLGATFPKLNYSVVQQLDHSDLDPLFEAQKRLPAGQLGLNATMDFLLNNVFAIDTESISNEVELLRTLLRIHYCAILIPSMLQKRLIKVLKSKHAFTEWPLDAIIINDSAFFEFLQERWPLFLLSINQQKCLGDVVTEYAFRYPGPDILPFGDHDIKIYIDNLFLEKKLKPILADTIPVDFEPGSWILAGVISDKEKDDERRLEQLLTMVESGIPSAESRYNEWTSIAIKWAEINALLCNGNFHKLQNRFNTIRQELNTKFAIWLNTNLAGLINLPPAQPVMMHHIARRLARELERSNEGRVALVVIDGLSLDQWITVRKVLTEQLYDLVFEESAIFAWVPTTTSVSRQAIFSGKAPIFFPQSIHNTHSESNLWSQFWENQGVSRLDIVYQRSLRDGNPVEDLEKMIHPKKTKVAGLVVDKVDKIMHGMQLGASGMHNQIAQWMQTGYLSGLVNHLLDYGFQIWLTSDHGNIECTGIGNPLEGAIADTRGERVRVYPTTELRDRVAHSFPSARNWKPVGLPADYFPLVISANDAFVTVGETIVGHGGIAIEEVIVPLIKIERRT